MEGRADDTRSAPTAGVAPYPGGQFAQLAVRSEGHTVRSVPLAGDLRIGRDGDNDLVLDSTQVAAHHARIYSRDGSFFLCNIDSAPTVVNGITLIGQRRLRDGDRIRVGNAQLLYRAVPPSSGEPVGDEPDATFFTLLRTTSPAPHLWDRLHLPRRRKKSRAAQGRQRKPAVMPTPAGILVLVAIAAIVAYLVAPDSFEPRRPDRRLTAAIAASGPVAGPDAQATATDTAGGDRPSVGAAGSSETPDALASFLAEAEMLTRRSQFDAAIERYLLLAEEAPRDARVEAGWAWALILDGDVEQGLVHAQQATEIDPDSAAAWTVLARAYVAQGNADDALPAARRAVDLEGGHEYPASEPAYRPDEAGAARAHAMLAEAYLLGGLIPQAVEQADVALTHSRTSADALSVRGRLYLLDGNDAEAAVTALRQAAELEPELWVRHQELGMMLLNLDQHRAAIEALTQAMVLARKPATYTTLGRAHYHLGEYDQAKSYLEQSLSFGIDDAETYALLAVMNAEQGRCDDARVYYTHAFGRDPSQPLALQAQAVCDSRAAAPTAAPAQTATPGAASTPSLPTATPPGPAVPAPSATPSPPLPGRIAFSTWNAALGDYDTYVARPDGSDRRLVASQMHQPAFRSDGRWLALNGEQPLHMNLHIVRLDGGEPIEISTYLEDSLPRWSPDGEGLIYSSTSQPDRQPRLYIVDEVPLDGRRAEDRPVRADIYEVLGDYPTWLPDGRIVYTGCDWSSGTARCGLFAVSSAPGPQTLQPLTDYPGDTAAAAGPRGQVAFMSDRDGNWEVYLLQSDGSVRRLTQHPANDGLPAWSPDGNYLAFVSDRGGSWAIWVMHPDGTDQRQLFALGEGGLAVDWQHESISWGREP